MVLLGSTTYPCISSVAPFPPAARLDTLDFKAGIASGFYLHCHRSQKVKGSTRPVAIRLGDGTSERRLTMRIPIGVDEVKGLPYIDEMEQLRIWDRDRQRDNVFSGGASSLDGIAVRHRWPKLFAYAQSLGYWKTL